MGIVTAVRQAAAAAIAPFAASLADRFRRERVMLASDAGRIGCSAGIAVLVAAGSPTIAVYALAVGASVSGAVFRPAEASLVPLVARSPQELTAANVAASTLRQRRRVRRAGARGVPDRLLGLHGLLRRDRGDVRVERALRRADHLRCARGEHVFRHRGARRRGKWAAFAARRVPHDRSRAAPTTPDRPLRRPVFRRRRARRPDRRDRDRSARHRQRRCRRPPVGLRCRRDRGRRRRAHTRLSLTAGPRPRTGSRPLGRAAHRRRRTPLLVRRGDRAGRARDREHARRHLDHDLDPAHSRSRRSRAGSSACSKARSSRRSHSALSPPLR